MARLQGLERISVGVDARFSARAPARVSVSACRRRSSARSASRPLGARSSAIPWRRKYSSKAAPTTSVIEPHRTVSRILIAVEATESSRRHSRHFSALIVTAGIFASFTSLVERRDVVGQQFLRGAQLHVDLRGQLLDSPLRIGESARHRSPRRPPAARRSGYSA